MADGASASQSEAKPFSPSTTGWSLVYKSATRVNFSQNFWLIIWHRKEDVTIGTLGFYKISREQKVRT